MTQSPYSHYSSSRSKKESSTSKALLGALSGTILGYGGGRLLGGIPLGADDRGQWNSSRSITGALVGIPVGAGLGALIGSLKQDDQEDDDARTASKNKKTKKSDSHYSPSRSKSAYGNADPIDANVVLANLSGNNAINYGVSAAVPGAIAGLGGAGIGALIQALRGKSIGKGALIGGGIGGLAGAGTGALAKYVSDAMDPLGAESLRTARQIVSSTDPIEKEKLNLRMQELALLR